MGKGRNRQSQDDYFNDLMSQQAKDADSDSDIIPLPSAAKSKSKSKGKKNTSKPVQKAKPVIVDEIDISDSESESDDENLANNNTKDLILENISVNVPGKTLLRETDVRFVYGRRYGIIGKNGAGKTTLLRSLVNKTFKTPKNMDIFYVEQEVIASNTVTAYESVLESNSKRSKLLIEQNRLEKLMENNDSSKLLEKYTKVSTELEGMGADKDESIIRKILFGLGFSTHSQNKPTLSFSGGWRMRLSIARALYLQPHLLLLDEPTNHLDLNASIWLTNYLTYTWKNSLVVISHDKDFLNEICTDIIHLTEHKLNYYKGNYNQYKQMFIQQGVNREKEWTKIEKKKKEMQKTGKTKKEVNEFMEKSNHLKPEKPYEVHISFAPVASINIPVMEIKDIDFGYDNKELIYKKMNFGLDMDSRITIVGANGVGKSTLLKLVAKELEPTSGEVFHNSRLRLGYYHQHTIEYLPLDETPVEFIMGLDNDITIQDARKYLGMIGLEGKLHTKKIELLSGGEKSRVALVAIFVEKPHIILFDEPTNHLDIETVEALVKAIKEYNGGVIMVTHDVDLIVETDCILWEINNGKIKETTYDAYHDRILDEVSNYE